MENIDSYLPPGFRFHPTDEELIMQYLKKKLTSDNFHDSIVADVDIYKFDPWDLPARATFGEKEWYFFSPRDRKYPNGARPNRAAGSGYWKATGTDKVITTSSPSSSAQEVVGVKKALVFYKGKPPKGIKTNWIMHEYRLTEGSVAPRVRDGSMTLDDWVLCRIYKKSQSKSAAASCGYEAVDREEQRVVKNEENASFWSMLEAMECSLMDDSCSYITNEVENYERMKMKRRVEDEDYGSPKRLVTSGNTVNSFSYMDEGECNSNYYFNHIY